MLIKKKFIGKTHAIVNKYFQHSNLCCFALNSFLAKDFWLLIHQLKIDTFDMMIVCRGSMKNHFKLLGINGKLYHFDMYKSSPPRTMAQFVRDAVFTLSMATVGCGGWFALFTITLRLRDSLWSLLFELICLAKYLTCFENSYFFGAFSGIKIQDIS